MAFTDSEMAILCQLSYRDGLKKDDSLYKHLNDMIINPKGKQEQMLVDQYKDVMEGLLNKTKGKDYRIVKQQENDLVGFSAVAIKDPNNEVTVACRGTEGFSLDKDSSKDVFLGDLVLLNSEVTPQQVSMEKFMKDIEKSYGPFDGYYFTGHSLGGNVATHGALTFEPESKVKGVVTFNAPGFSQEYITLHAADFMLLNDKMIHYQNEYDIVSSIFIMPGKCVIVPSALDDHSFDDHSLFAFKVDSNGNFVRKDPQLKHPTTYGITIFTEIADTDLKLAIKIVAVLAAAFVIYKGGELAVSKVIKYVNALSDKYNPTDSAIKVDTWKLRDYANRLEKVNKKLQNIDKRLNSFYLKASVDEQIAILKVDISVGPEYSLHKCINYLRDTAYDFEEAERKIYKKMKELKV